MQWYFSGECGGNTWLAPMKQLELRKVGLLRIHPQEVKLRDQGIE
jgi:hypothetical protein